MPPKFYSKPKRPYTTGKGEEQKKNSVSVTFLLVGHDKIGVEIPYKAFTSDDVLKKLIKDKGGVWDRDERMWTLRHKDYLSLLDEMIEHCNAKQYYCSKVPAFVYDAQLDMPLDLPVRLSKQREAPIVSYMQMEVHIDPETLPFYDRLYDFQKESLRFGIQHHGRMLLADEMGVGKTLQSLAIAFIFRYEWPMVIICPSTLRYNWLNQISNWYGQHIKKNQLQVYTKGGVPLKDSVKILIISYDLAWKFKEVWSDFKVAIVDEAHYLKNSGCKRTDILVPELAKKKRVILLTGTPAFARPREIFNLASIIRPDALYNFTQFGNRYCEPTRNPWSGAIQYNGCKNSKELFYLLKDKIMIRRLKKDVLTQLPDKQRQKITIQTNKQITKEIGSLIEVSGPSKSEERIMEMFRFRGEGLGDHQKQRESLMEAYRLSGAAKIDGVVEYILEMLENDVKLLIFAHHRAILDRIESELNAKKYKSIRIDGEVEMSQRQNQVDIFQNNKQVMAALLSISAAGVGLTLTASSTVVFAELHWTPGMLIQAEDRAHRIGQKNCVNCHYLIGEGTLDSILYNYLLKKINNVSTFVDGQQQQLEIEELGKGEKGKVSKSALMPDRKQKGAHEVQKTRINPIRRQININLEGECSEATDIESQLTNNPFRTKQDEETASLRSRRSKAPMPANEELNEDPAQGSLIDSVKLKILKDANCVLPQQNSGTNSVRTYDLLKWLDERSDLGENISKNNSEDSPLGTKK